MDNYTVNFTTVDASTNYPLLVDSWTISVSIVFLFGLPTHSYVLWLIVTGSSGVASEFFILNLCVCEIGNSLNGLLGLLNCFFPHFTILAYFFQGLAVTGRPLFQCLMCVERYLAVVHPVTFLKYKPLRCRVICCTVAWIIILGSCLLCMFTLIPFGLVSYIWFFSSQFLVFLSIQLFCLVAILRALKKSGPGERKREKEENHIKRRAFYLILITTMNINIQYVPFTVTGFFVILTQQYIFDYWFPASYCYALAGFVQPVLYLQRAGKLSCPTC